MERKWTATRIEKYAEKWFQDNNFKFELVKQYVSKTVYDVQKDGITERFELPSNVTDSKNYMRLFGESFEMKKNIERMKKELNMK